MLRTWTLESAGKTIILRLTDLRSAGNRRVSKANVQRVSVDQVERWLRLPASRGPIVEIFRALGGTLERDLWRIIDIGRVRARILRAFECGEIVAQQPDPVVLIPVGRKWGDSGGEVESIVHTIEFDFLYEDGSPAAGIDYSLTDPRDFERTGRTGREAVVSLTGVEPGVYVAVVREIERTHWETKRVKVGESVRVVARTAGFSTGTAATVKIFRQYAEKDDQVLATANAKVDHDKLEFEVTIDDDLVKKSGVGRGLLPLIAEVSIESGKYWSKTVEPLLCECKTLKGVRWKNDMVEDGASAVVIADTLGFAASIKGKIEVFRHHVFRDPEKLFELKDVVLDDHVEIPVVLGVDPSDGMLTESGEYYAVVHIPMGADSEIVGTTELVWAHPAKHVRAPEASRTA